MLRYRLRESTRSPFPCPEDMNPTLHALLVQRGVASAEEAKRFLNPEPSHLHDPYLLSDMAAAVSRIREALEKSEPVCVYGDYDVDGVSASSLLSDYLRSKGAQVEVYLPSRHTEGYGLNEAAIRGVAQRNQLMITVDCGVTSVELIELAKSLGLSCIVTDHHQPAAVLPDCPVINPLLNGYPFPSLCGAGVAFKLVQALGGVNDAMKYVDIAALATVADVVPLTDENRVIVKLGLERINRAPRPGIKALIDVSALSEKKINAGNIAFQLAPRLNAGGRIGSAKRSYDLLLAPDAAWAQPIAAELEEENRARKDIEQQILSEAEKQLENFDFPAHRAIVIAGEGWNHGVIGLAASRLVEKYHYPVILMAEHDGVLTGSCRSIPGVDIHAALTAVSQHLTKFGGHKQAAGLTLDADKLEAFRNDLDAWLWENIPPACYIPEQEYDLSVHFDELTEAFVAGLEALQPTGFGNPAPVLRASPYVVEQRGVGADGAHLRLVLSEHSVQRAGIFFRGGHLAGKLPETVDILFTPKLNTYMGRTSVQAELKAVNSDDVLAEISSKSQDEEGLQHEFLTEMLYNIRINYSTLGAESLSAQGLKEMLEASPQGTLILTAGLDAAREITVLAGSAAPDLFIRSIPDDPRAFNALCAYPPRKLPGGYRRIVLAGMPEWIELPGNAEIYRMDMDAAWRKTLPDVDQLRNLYKAVRSVLAGPARTDEYDTVIHLTASRSGLSHAAAAAGLLTLHDMGLIELDPNTFPCTLKMNATRKTDPESSAVWRALQAWRTDH
ncbi:MAG: single-stranded-DNA-specific exonuclease RecJ [Clostridia bacterium]|nr:single-stranded-DNA-specific exonuclease RecJ [Clostridia bacterium]